VAEPIEAVFFDIGNVLLSFDAKRVAAKIAWAVRRHPLRIARYLMDSQAVDSVERGKLSGDDLYRMFQLELGYAGSYAAFIKLWCDHFTLNRANFSLLQRVAKGRKVYLLSNTNALHYDFIKTRYAFPKHVHGAILSHELGLRKPEPAIYEAAVKLAGVPAARCLFIDDLASNVEGARRCGLQVIHHKKGHDLRVALNDLGLI
jgi:FMN phosphatase YigB (HAD superfamily)